MIRFFKSNGSSFNFLSVTFFVAKMSQVFGGPRLFYHVMITCVLEGGERKRKRIKRKEAKVYERPSYLHCLW